MALKLNNGGDPALQTADPAHCKIIHRAQFKFCLPECCDGSRSRKYFHIYENAYEFNFPTANPFCPCIPPNCLCPGHDCICKFYFDRGIFDMQNCCRAVGALRGAPRLLGESRKYVCCCMDLPDSCNRCCDNQCCNSCCGEEIRIQPFETYCFCCSTRASWCNNFCGLCGLKSGEPAMLYSFVGCLETGEGVRAQDAFNNARQQWSARTGLE